MTSPADPNQSAGERRFEVAAAGHLGDLATPRLALSDPDPTVRSAALGALGRLGGLSAGDIINGLGDPSPIVRIRAIEAAIPEHDIDLRPMLSDSEHQVVETAAFALGERDDDAGAVPELVAVADDHPDELCRESAVAALGALGQAPGVDEEALITCLLRACAGRAAIRRRAIIGLHQFDDPRAETAVRNALTDPDRQTRGLAGELLGEPVD